jgi:hypothetical protein
MQKSTLQNQDGFLAGEAPVNGQTPMEILPEEQKALKALNQALLAFNAIAENEELFHEQLIMEFSEGIRQAQLAVGTLQFQHQLNQQYRQQMGLPASPTNCDSLEAARNEFFQKVTGKSYPTAFQSVLTWMTEAWEQLLHLASQYPSQGAGHDFISGLTGCENVLDRLAAQSLAIA